MAQFKTGDIVLYVNPAADDRRDRVEIIRTVEDDPLGPLYTIKFLTGKEKFLVTHAFEDKIEPYVKVKKAE